MPDKPKCMVFVFTFGENVNFDLLISGGAILTPTLLICASALASLSYLTCPLISFSLSSSLLSKSNSSYISKSSSRNEVASALTISLAVFQ